MQTNYQSAYNEYLQKLAELNREEERQMSNMSILSWDVLEEAKKQIAETFRLRREELAATSPYQEAILYRQQMIDAWNAYLQAKRQIDIDELQSERTDVEQKLNTTEQKCGSAQANMEKEKAIFENAKIAYEAAEKLYKDTILELDSLRQRLDTITEKERRHGEEINHTHGRYITAAKNYWISIFDEMSGDYIKELIIQGIGTRADNEEDFIKTYNTLIGELVWTWFVMPANVKNLKKVILWDSNWSFDALMDAIYWKKTEIEPEDNKENIPEWNKTEVTSQQNLDETLSGWNISKEDVVGYLDNMWKSGFDVKYIARLRSGETRIKSKPSWSFDVLLNKQNDDYMTYISLTTQLVNLYKNPMRALNIIIHAPLSLEQMKIFLSTVYSKVVHENEDRRNSSLDWLNNNIKQWEWGRLDLQSYFLGAFYMRPGDINSDDCPKSGHARWWDCSWNWKAKRPRKYYHK